MCTHNTTKHRTTLDTSPRLKMSRTKNENKSERSNHIPLFRSITSLKVQFAITLCTILFIFTTFSITNPFNLLFIRWRRLSSNSSQQQPQSTIRKPNSINIISKNSFHVEDENLKREESKYINFIPKNSFKNIEEQSKIKTIVLIGERNSGTSWMYDQLQKCYNNTSLTIQKKVSRDKHWFQFYDPSQIDESMLVITQYRNPYHWILSMMSQPHHAPNHQFLDWYSFVTKPWMMERGGYDLNMTDHEKSIHHGCKQNFSYHEIISCSRIQYPLEYYGNITTHYSAKRPFYELRNDGSGIPYSSIVELRTDKIKNFLNVSTYPFVKQLITLQYEDLLSYGTNYILKPIEEITGVGCNDDYVPTPPQPNRKQRALDDLFVKWMNKYVDWEVEGLIGYYPINLTVREK